MFDAEPRSLRRGWLSDTEQSLDDGLGRVKAEERGGHSEASRPDVPASGRAGRAGTDSDAGPRPIVHSAYGGPTRSQGRAALATPVAEHRCAVSISRPRTAARRGVEAGPRALETLAAAHRS